MEVTLLDIPGLSHTDQAVWRVRALAIDGKSPCLAALAAWAKFDIKAYKKILNVLRLVGSVNRVTNEDKVTKCAIDGLGHVYEARADKLKARLFFFIQRKMSL